MASRVSRSRPSTPAIEALVLADPDDPLFLKSRLPPSLVLRSYLDVLSPGLSVRDRRSSVVLLPMTERSGPVLLRHDQVAPRIVEVLNVVRRTRLPRVFAVIDDPTDATFDVPYRTIWLVIKMFGVDVNLMKPAFRDTEDDEVVLSKRWFPGVDQRALTLPPYRVSVNLRRLKGTAAKATQIVSERATEKATAWYVRLSGICELWLLPRRYLHHFHGGLLRPFGPDCRLGIQVAQFESIYDGKPVSDGCIVVFGRSRRLSPVQFECLCVFINELTLLPNGRVEPPPGFARREKRSSHWKATRSQYRTDLSLALDRLGLPIIRRYARSWEFDPTFPIEIDWL